MSNLFPRDPYKFYPPPATRWGRIKEFVQDWSLTVLIWAIILAAIFFLPRGGTSHPDETCYSSRFDACE